MHSEIVLPAGPGEWATDRGRLWNVAELAETRRNSTVARKIAARHRCAVDLSIHRPDRKGDKRNHHAHVLCTTRRPEGSHPAEKTRELDGLKTGG